MSLVVVVKNVNPLSPHCDIVAQLAVEQATQKSTGFCGHVFNVFPMFKIRKGKESDVHALRDNGIDVDIVRLN